MCSLIVGPTVYYSLQYINTVNVSKPQLTEECTQPVFRRSVREFSSTQSQQSLLFMSSPIYIS